MIQVIFMMIFFCVDGFQNLFLYQVTFNALELKAGMLLVENQKIYLNLDFFHYMVLSYLI